MIEIFDGFSWPMKGHFTATRERLLFATRLLVFTDRSWPAKRPIVSSEAVVPLERPNLTTLV
jgi:hypothetical protein